MNSKCPDTRGNPFGIKWTRIGFWNVRTSSYYGKLKQVEKEMTNYKLDITGLSEIWWKDNRETKIQNGNSLIFSVIGEDKEHKKGVGILMNKEARESLMEWSPISERIILACFKENGELFSELCAKCDLIIGGTVFPHKICHEVSWVSPDNTRENQTEHTAISKRFRRSLLDVRNKRSWYRQLPPSHDCKR